MLGEVSILLNWKMKKWCLENIKLADKTAQLVILQIRFSSIQIVLNFQEE